MFRAYLQALHINLRVVYIEEHFWDGGLAWEMFLQGLDMTSGELVNGARKECGKPLTLANSLSRAVWAQYNEFESLLTLSEALTRMCNWTHVTGVMLCHVCCRPHNPTTLFLLLLIRVGNSRGLEFSVAQINSMVPALVKMS